MRVYFLLFLLCSGLFLPISTRLISEVQAQSQNTYSLEIQGLTWNRMMLNVLLITPDNMSWWNPLYLNSTLRAIGQWNEAISYFASNYSDYAYLSNLKMLTTISKRPLTGFDIYINWTEFPLANTNNEIGLSTLTSEENVILNSNISLGTHTSHGDSLTDRDMQNVALHELGHNLGLGHCNYTSDTMFPEYTLLSPPRLISTLDAYGVAIAFEWLQNSFSFYPVDAWLQNNVITVPPNIPYKYLAVSPLYSTPKTLADNPAIQTLILLFQLIIHPEIFAIILVLIIVFVLIAVFPRKQVLKPAS
jgi:predicted Zn-dependent protease